MQRDSSGGGWFDQIESRVQGASNNWTNSTTNYAKDGTTVLSGVTETLDATNTVRTEFIDADGSGGSGGYETRNRERVITSGGVVTTEHITWNRDASLRAQETEVIAANGRDKMISRDADGNGVFETVENLVVTFRAAIELREQCTRRLLGTDLRLAA